MSTKTQPERQPTTAQAAWSAATEATTAAGHALDAAADAVPRAHRDLADAEARLVEILTSAGSDGPSRAQIGKGRTDVEKARAEIEWAAIAHRAAEQCYSQAVDHEAAARRRVVAEEYRAEVARWTGPENREPELRKQIEDLVAELVITIADRNELHGRLGQAVASFPEDERLQLPARGRGLTNPRPSWYAGLPVTVPHPELQEAIKEGLGHADAALRERERAARFDG